MKLSVLLVPNARQNELVGWQDGALKIRINAPPHEGKANEALIDFLAEVLDLAPSEISITRGTSSKHKQIDLPCVKEDIDAVLARLS